MRALWCGLVGCLFLGLSALTFAKAPREINGSVETNRVVVGPWEKVTIESGGGEVVALRFETGYLSAEGGGGGDAFANAPVANVWEQWRLVRHADGAFSFVSADGRHVLTAEPPSVAFPAGRVRVDRQEIGPWERFAIDGHDDVTALRSLPTGHYLSAQELPGAHRP